MEIVCRVWWSGEKSLVTNMTKVDKIEAKRTKPGTGMKRVQESEAKGEPSSLFDFEEVMNNNHNQEPPLQNGPPPMVIPNGQAPRTMKELFTKIDTFYNGLTLSHRDTINAAAGGTFMQKTPEECYELIENMTAHHNHWDTSAIRDETSLLLLLSTVPKLFDAVGGYTQETAYATTGNYNSGGTGLLPSNTVPNPWEDLKVITTRSGVTLAGPLVSPFSSSKEPSPASTSFSTISSSKMPEVTKDMVQASTENIQPPVAQTQILIYEPVVAPKPKPTIPYPSRVNKQKLRFALMFKSLLNNKEKLFDLATTLGNENCSAAILKKLPEKLGDLGKFLIPCDFLEFDECLALADLAGIAEDVFVKVGKFHFPTDFVVVDYVVDPRVPLILGRPFLRTGRALIDVYGEELTFRVDDEAITFKVGQTLKYSYNNTESINLVDVIDVACERKPRKGQNRIKTGQKREACQSRGKFKAVAVEKGRKTEENAKRMVENAYTVKKLFKL
nr:hypothetical protein [Tanacetum cinerariifolium]